jgi:transposase
LHILSTGCQWRYIPKDLPAKSTLYRYFCDWGYDGTLDRIHHVLYLKCREKLEREASPAAGRKRGKAIAACHALVGQPAKIWELDYRGSSDVPTFLHRRGHFNVGATIA